jgi:hypothetical protein
MPPAAQGPRALENPIYTHRGALEGRPLSGLRVGAQAHRATTLPRGKRPMVGFLRARPLSHRRYPLDPSATTRPAQAITSGKAPLHAPGCAEGGPLSGLRAGAQAHRETALPREKRPMVGFLRAKPLSHRRYPLDPRATTRPAQIYKVWLLQHMTSQGPLALEKLIQTSTDSVEKPPHPGQKKGCGTKKAHAAQPLPYHGQRDDHNAKTSGARGFSYCPHLSAPLFPLQPPRRRVG